MSEEVMDAIDLAPIESDALPNKNQISDQHAPFYDYLLQAVDRVRSLSKCNRVLWADFSVSVEQHEAPVIYVRYENRKSDISNAYFSVQELEGSG